MQMTITIDDELYAKALELAAPCVDQSELVREAIQTFVRIQAGKRLAALAGTMPDIEEIPRQRSAS